MNNRVQDLLKPRIQDYLHLYLGCEVMDFNTQEIERLQGLNFMFGETYATFYPEGRYALPLHEIKLILRPLSDMTEEEFLEFKVIADNDFNKMVRISSVEIETNLAHQFKATAFLLSKHFDLFGLIENGLAIDKTKLNQTS